MALTDQERERIIEEEALRASIRKGQAADTRNVWGWVLLIGGAVIALLGVPLFWLVALFGLLILFTTGAGWTLLMWVIGLFFLLAFFGSVLPRS